MAQPTIHLVKIGTALNTNRGHCGRNYSALCYMLICGHGRIASKSLVQQYLRLPGGLFLRNNVVWVYTEYL